MKYTLIEHRVKFWSTLVIVVRYVVLTTVVLTQPLFALDQTKTAPGNDHLAAQQAYNVDGMGVRVGIIEWAIDAPSAGINNTKSHIAGRLVSSFSFLGLVHSFPVYRLQRPDPVIIARLSLTWRGVTTIFTSG